MHRHVHAGCPERGRRFIQWFYIVYFALGMPFICWGAVATPGHPHRLPHLVFALPAIGMPTRQQPEAHLGHGQHGVTHLHQPSVAKQTVTSQPPPPTGQPSDVTGRSTPDASAITLLALIFVGAWRFQWLPQFLFAFNLGDLYKRPFTPIPLTPPPR